MRSEAQPRLAWRRYALPCSAMQRTAERCAAPERRALRRGKMCGRGTRGDLGMEREASLGVGTQGRDTHRAAQIRIAPPCTAPR